MANPQVLKAASREEVAAFDWLEERAGLVYLDDFLFFPLLLGGINLGYVRVNIYVRTDSAGGRAVGWRVRPRPTGQEKTLEQHFITQQEANSVVKIVRIDSQDAIKRPSSTFSAALRREER